MSGGLIAAHFHLLRAPAVCHFTGAPGAIPTRDLPLRRRTLYATELREHVRVDSKW